MNYRDYFAPYVAKINSYLDQFFNEKIQEGEKFDSITGDVWRKLQEFMVGGKRMRGGLVKLGYECFKKADEEKILPVSAAMEITHGAILLHDDIIDQSPLRHGRPTVHKRYEEYHRKHYQKGESGHYGESLAIVVGIAGYYGAISLLTQAEFPENLKVQAIAELCRFMIETGYGETLDIDLAYQDQIAEKEVLAIHTLKAAQYTIVGPLKIGGILAGVRETQLKKFEDFGLPVGIAFQLQDDLLGIFGSEEEVGKRSGDDIVEGKNTLLYTQALKRGNSSQRKRLKGLWGKREISNKEIEEVKQIIRETGAFAYSVKLAHQLVDEGKKAIPQITKKKDLKEIFLTLADFVVGRTK